LDCDLLVNTTVVNAHFPTLASQFQLLGDSSVMLLIFMSQAFAIVGLNTLKMGRHTVPQTMIS